MIIVYFLFSTRAKWPITAWYATSMYNNKLNVEDTRFYLPFYIWMSENQKKKVAKSCTHVLNCVSIDPAFNISISFSFSFLFLLETPINSKNTLAYWTIDAFNKHNRSFEMFRVYFSLSLTLFLCETTEALKCSEFI